jgi:hypothetical protein
MAEVGVGAWMAGAVWTTTDTDSEMGRQAKQIHDLRVCYIIRSLTLYPL